MMNENIFVSICIPAYNHPNFLEKCLNSIIGQTFTNFEVIITDDSIHEELKFIADKIGDYRIKYIKNSYPLGSPKNWNHCISLATGSLIKIMHHDDWFESNDSLQKFVDVFINHPNADFAFSQCYNVSNSKTTIHAPSKKLIEKIIKTPILLLFGNVIGAPSTITFTKRVAQNVLFKESSSWYVDIIFYIDLVLANFKVIYIQQPLINITTESEFQVTNSISGIKKAKEAIDTFKLYSSVYSRFKVLSFLQLVEIFTRYEINSLEQLGLLDYNQTIKYAFRFSQMRINYRIYALIRRIYVRFFA